MWREFGNHVTTCQRAANSLNELRKAASLTKIKMRTGQTFFAAVAATLALAVVIPVFGANSPGKVLAAAAPKSKKQKHAPGEEIFDNKTVLPMRIEISDKELAVLRAQPADAHHDVRGMVWEGTNVYRDVGVH